MTSETERVQKLIPDYPAIQKELLRLLQSDPLLYTLHHVAVDQDWEQTRALKTAVVLLAAHAADLLRHIELLDRNRPIIIEMPAGSMPVKSGG